MARNRIGSSGFSRSDLALSLVGGLSLLTAGLHLVSDYNRPVMHSPNKTVWDVQNLIDEGRFTRPENGFRTQWGYRVMGPYAGWHPLRRGGEIDLIKNGYLGLENANGGYALDLRGNPGSSGNNGVKQVVNLAPGQRYLLSFEAVNVTQEAQAGIKIYLDQTQLIQVQPGAGATQMTRHEKLFHVPATSGRQQEITLQSFGARQGQNGVFIDNVQVSPY